MITGRCQGCGRRQLLISFRGHRCISCVFGATENRSDERDYWWDRDEIEAKDGRTNTDEKEAARQRAIGKLGQLGVIMTPARIEEAIKMRKAKVPCVEIAKLFGVSPSRISYLTRRNVA